MHISIMLTFAAVLLAVAPAFAQDAYPNRPIRWIVPFPAGGPTDTLSRILAAKLGDVWKSGIVIENKGGAAGAIGTDFAAKSAPDGYTIQLGTQSTNASNKIFYPNLPYDPIADFEPLTLLGTACMALVIPNSVPATNPNELVEWIKKQDGGVPYASAATGSSQHIAAELLVKRTGIKATHVPYRGSSAAQPDLIAGRVAFMFDNLPSALPQARAGKVRALAQTCKTRSPSAPDLPTMVEAGFADFVVDGWYGMFAPARTPKAIVDKLSADINKALKDPDSLEKWKTLGFDPIGSTPAEFAKLQKDDLAYWKQMIEYTGVKVEWGGMEYDLKIVGGEIVDGSGAPRRKGDLGIKDGRVVALGEAPGSAVETIDATGMIVSPGFVDVHTHYDAQVLWDPMLTISPWHGVTSVVVGNCGFGVAPTKPEHRDLILRTLERVEGMSLAALKAGIGEDWPFQTFPEYMDALDGRPLGINVAVMVGHTPVRLSVMGDEATTRAATPAEVAIMKGIVAEAMEVGAVGFATSVSKVHIGYSGRPVPSRLAEFGEMLEIADAVGKSGHGIIHYNVGRGPRWDEYEALHAKSGRPVIWTALLAGSLGPNSHRPQLAKSDELIKRGLPIYPQGACRPIQIEFDFRSPVVFDTFASFERLRAAGTDDERRAVYANKAFRDRVKTQLAGPGPDDQFFMGKQAEGDSRREVFRNLVVSDAPDKAMLERKLVDLAQEHGIDPVDFMFDLAARDLRIKLRANVLNFEEAEVREIVQDPNVLIALGDGGAHMSQLCDACYATHLLGHWVRQDKAITLEQAVHQLTQRPADIFGLTDRGRLAVGLPADVVVFDPATVGASPLERVHDLPAGEDRLISRPRGVKAVIVNGVVLPEPGTVPAHPSGKLLRQKRVPAAG